MLEGSNYYEREVDVASLRKAALAVIIDVWGPDNTNYSNMEKLVRFSESRSRKKGKIPLRLDRGGRPKGKTNWTVRSRSISLQELFPSVPEIKEILYGTKEGYKPPEGFNYELHNLRWRDLSLREFGRVGTVYLRKIAGEKTSEAA